MKPLLTAMTNIDPLIYEPKGCKYIVFRNSEGKIWKIPYNTVRIGLCLYQPSSFKGIILKYLLPSFKFFKTLLNMFHAQICKYQISHELDEIIRYYFNITGSYELSYFGGTPSARQKVTLQISSKNKILGYCKLTDNHDIYNTFIHENNILSFLKERKVTNIPDCLSTSSSTHEIYHFIQTTIKSTKSKYLHEPNHLHFEKLTEIFHKTSIALPFTSTDYWKLVSTINNYSQKFKSEDFQIIKKNINYIYSYYSKKEKVIFCLYHGDFTPWNSFIESDKLFLFDFEYAAYSCPPYMDLMHFIIQSLWLEKKANVKDILKYYNNIIPHLSFISINSNILLLSYLLYITAFYLHIDGLYDYTDKGFALRLSLIKEISKEIKY